ncbi:SanA/YdcF family protein [Aequorivita viscosa]|uniref:SanA protein n=1 Tax=Aequorivita viscosa TaxID=797419 RepID=A0A1M6IEX1_9FLAO|nr:ElyC/SanA/YdcF family protein [Aequorivita viscosa]SDW56819.1 SanA protein [Aequorivita viscosa]SHJ32978.1 SanA protein [Aequorivita viscosa]
MNKKKLIYGLISLFVAVFLLLVISNYSIARIAKNKTYFNTSEIKKNKVGLLLGTAKYYKSGGINLYFKYRIDAAVELYKSGKIEYILVSGDNSSVYYNEPMTFKKELIKRGVPAEVIYLDYAGFRTLDSVIRSKEIFEQTEITIISQQFQNERAIYIAESKGINAIGFNAKDMEGTHGLKVKFREYFARTKAFIDIAFNVQPRFYGEKVPIGINQVQDCAESN